ncbi:MAG: GGDEF domain-containing protein [Chloroflexota bacterium]|nr:GGDEF domain-containing protein [Chloroflexota bacterium]
MERRPSGPAIRAVLGSLSIVALMAPVFVLPALPSMELGGGIAWVVSASAAALLIASAGATIASVIVGMRRGSLAALLLSGGFAALAGGSVALATGSSSISLPIAAAAVLVLAAAAAERLGALVTGRDKRIAVAGIVLLGAEAAVVAELLPAAGGLVVAYRTPMLAAAAALAIVASAVAAGRDLTPAAVALALGAAALAIGRDAGVELLFALAAFTGASLLVLRAFVEHGRPAVEADDQALPALAMQLSEGVLRFDGHLRLRSWNPAARALLGLDEASAGVQLEDLLGVSLAQLPAGSETVLRRTPIGGLELSIHRESSAITVVVYDPGVSADAERLGRELRGTIEELLQARRTVELQRSELERATTTDPLTGVASRGAIIDRLRVEVAQARRYQHSVAVVLLDVDRFGELNAAHGIDAGDMVLREVALRARLRVRASDAIGRSGSDGLLAILPHTDEGGAAIFADALRRRIGERAIALDGVEVRATLSGGVAVMRSGDDLDADSLLARAEEALESARVAGGDRIALDRLHGLARLEPKEPAATQDAASDEGAQR